MTEDEKIRQLKQEIEELSLKYNKINRRIYYEKFG